MTHETATTPTARPPYLPERFWDDQNGQARIEEMARALADLENAAEQGTHLQGDIPDRPENYQITSHDELVRSDAHVNQRLHEAGFTHAQAQLVYDLAYEVIAPYIAQMTNAYHCQHQISRLSEKFGGPERWRETARQLETWGKAHLPTSVFEAMAGSYEGVLALYDMMRKGEPGLSDGGEIVGQAVNEQNLRSMMRDPRYWKEQDPDYINKVRDGFRKLYGGNK